MDGWENRGINKKKWYPTPNCSFQVAFAPWLSTSYWLPNTVRQRYRKGLERVWRGFAQIPLLVLDLILLFMSFFPFDPISFRFLSFMSLSLLLHVWLRRFIFNNVLSEYLQNYLASLTWSSKIPMEVKRNDSTKVIEAIFEKLHEK